MTRQATYWVGALLILGAAVGYAFGLVVTDPGTAAIYGAAGAGIGIVFGAIVAALTRPTGVSRG